MCASVLPDGMVGRGVIPFGRRASVLISASPDGRLRGKEDCCQRPVELPDLGTRHRAATDSVTTLWGLYERAPGEALISRGSCWPLPGTSR